VFILILVFFLLTVPDGFPPEDPFMSTDDACQSLSGKLAPKKWRARALDWCRYRVRHSTRGKRYVSRVDGSFIHDRDRPAAYDIYRHGLSSGRIDPWECEHDKIDASIRHSKAARKLAAAWPFHVPELTDAKRKHWLRSPADAERFGTRGPIDLNTEFARRYLPGCWDPASLDRNDVAAAVAVLGAVAICQKHGCRSNADIKRWWR
jgi:hypothetical protein